MPALAHVIPSSPNSGSNSGSNSSSNRVATYANPRFQPFDTAEEAWLWTMAALTARRDGARYGANKGLVSRPCDPDDVVRCLDALYRQHKITLAHARVLRLWGERQTAPSPSIAAEGQDHRVWVEALGCLEWPLRVKGILA